MTKPSGSALDRAAERHGLPEEARSKLHRFGDLLAQSDGLPPKWAEGAARKIDVALELLDLPCVRDATRFADLGSGAGFPGMPLAIAMPQAEAYLVEVNPTRAAFIRSAAMSLALDNVVVVQAPMGEWPDGRGMCDLVVCSAAGVLSVFLECAAPLLVLGGWSVQSSGTRRPEDERDGALMATATGLELVEIRNWDASGVSFDAGPLGEGEPSGGRCAYVYRKVAETPDEYPRPEVTKPKIRRMAASEPPRSSKG